MGNEKLAAALRFIAQDNNRSCLEAVIAEFKKGLPDASGVVVEGTPDKATVEEKIPPIKPLSDDDWDEWTDGQYGVNQKCILILLQQLSLLNYANPNGNASSGGQVTDKT